MTAQELSVVYSSIIVFRMTGCHWFHVAEHSSIMWWDFVFASVWNGILI